MIELPEDDWLAQADRQALSWLWRADLPRSGPRAWLRLPLRVLYLVVRNSYLGRLPFQANALTFMTLLGLVPALAVSFSVAKSLGYASELEKLLLDSEFTASQAEILTRIIGYVEQTQVGTLGVVGVVILLLTLVMTLASVEETFNLVWDVHQGRSWPRMFTDYLSVLAICPLFVLASTALWAAFSSLSVVIWVQNLEVLGPVTRWGMSLGPLALLTVALIFIYLFLPNTRVPFGPAVLGGVVGALLWWGVQSVYIYFQIGVARYNAIYGGFASLPLFFIWVQVSWMVLLFGNELAHASHVCFKGPLPRALEPKLQGARREWLGLRLLVLIGRRFVQGGPTYSPRDLAKELAAPERQVVALVRGLARAGLLSLLDACGVVQPARALEAVTLADVMAALRGDIALEIPPDDDPTLHDIWQRIEMARRQSLDGLTLADLVKE